MYVKPQGESLESTRKVEEGSEESESAKAEEERVCRRQREGCAREGVVRGW